jgi:hypothetical protein
LRTHPRIRANNFETFWYMEYLPTGLENPGGGISIFSNLLENMVHRVNAGVSEL